MLPNGEELNLRLKQSALVLTVLVALVLGVWILRGIWPGLRWVFDVLQPFLIALVVAYLFNPVVNFAQRRLHIGRVGGMLVVVFFVILVVVLFLGILTPILVAQMEGLLNVITKGLETIGEQLDRPEAREFQRGLGQALQEMVDWIRGQRVDMEKLTGGNGETAEKAAREGARWLSGAAGSLGVAWEYALNFIGGVFGLFSTFVFVFIISCYYLLDFHKIPGLIREVLPARIEDRTLEILGKLDVAVGGFLRGQLIVCTCVGVLASVGLFAVGMYKYAILVGVLAGVFNFVPYLGPIIGMVPAILWALLAESHDSWDSRFLHVGLVVGVFVIIQNIDGFILQPRVVGKNSNLSPLLVLLALLVGGRFGIGGMIVAVPLACVGRVLFLELFWNRWAEEQNAHPETSPDEGAAQT